MSRVRCVRLEQRKEGLERFWINGRFILDKMLGIS